MALKNVQVLVIGGGIGGLAAATALALRGARVRVLEQADTIREVGAGLQISPNGAVVLDALGVGARLREVGHRARAVDLKDYRSGSSVSLLDLSRLGEDQQYFFLHQLQTDPRINHLRE